MQNQLESSLQTFKLLLIGESLTAKGRQLVEGEIKNIELSIKLEENEK